MSVKKNIYRWYIAISSWYVASYISTYAPFCIFKICPNKKPILQNKFRSSLGVYDVWVHWVCLTIRHKMKSMFISELWCFVSWKGRICPSSFCASCLYCKHVNKEKRTFHIVEIRPEDAKILVLQLLSGLYMQQWSVRPWVVIKQS